MQGPGPPRGTRRAPGLPRVTLSTTPRAAPGLFPRNRHSRRCSCLSGCRETAPQHQHLLLLVKITLQRVTATWHEWDLPQLRNQKGIFVFPQELPWADKQVNQMRKYIRFTWAIRGHPPKTDQKSIAFKQFWPNRGTAYIIYAKGEKFLVVWVLQLLIASD